MSVENMAWVFKHSPYTGAKFAIHIAIADIANSAHGHEVKMRHAKIAQMARTSRATVSKTFAEMIDDGLLELVEDNSKKGHNSPSVFRMLCPNAADVVYDSRTKSGRPDDTDPEVTGPVSDFVKTKATREREALVAAGAPTLPGFDLVDAASSNRTDTDEADDDADDPVVQEERPDNVVSMMPPGQSRRSDPDTAASLYAELSQAPVDPDDDATIKTAAGAILGYYIKWRAEHGAGPLKTKSWHGQIVNACKAAMAHHGLSPQVVADIVVQWHDDSMSYVRRGGNPIQPGKIVSMAQTMMDRSHGAVMHGTDGHGTSARQQKTTTRLSALINPAAYENFI